MLPGGSGYLTRKQNMKMVTTKFKSGGLHEKHVVATWNFGNRLSICLQAQGNQGAFTKERNERRINKFRRKLLSGPEVSNTTNV